MPPSFYDADVDRWSKKFAAHVTARAAQKKQMGKTMTITCLTRNTNIKSVDDRGKGKKGKSVVKNADEKQGESLFDNVMKRRASRQSNYAPVVIDFNYAGDSSKVQHLLERRPDGQGFAGKSQLDFELNLRNYKNTTEFMAPKPFLFPTVKTFSPAKQWAEAKKNRSMVNGEYKGKKVKYNDKFAEKNANELLHQFDKHGINS